MMMRNGGRFWCSCLLLFCCWVSFATSNRLFLSPIAPPPQGHQGQTSGPTPQFSSKQGVRIPRPDRNKEDEEEVNTSSRLGSRPPSCRYRCKRCLPCEAIQIPAKSYPIGVLYANYEPEGWKCKCGASFFNP